MLKKAFKIVFFCMVSFQVQYGQNKKILYTNGVVGVDGYTKNDYLFEIYKNNSNFYIYLKKRIHEDSIIVLDSNIISKKTLPLNYYFASEGEFNLKKTTHYSLPAIVKKTKVYQGDFYKKIYRAWYYDIEKGKIVEIKLPNKNFKVYDQSHD